MTARFRSIVISGTIGSGTSTLSKLLAKKLGWKRIDVGEIVRQVFRERGWRIENANKMPPPLDREIDTRLKNLIVGKRHLIYEGQIAGWNSRGLPHVLRVLLVADFETRVKRFIAREGVSTKKAGELVRKRHRALNTHFRRLYGIRNRFDPKYFHLVLDTSRMTPQEEAVAVIKFLKKG